MSVRQELPRGTVTFLFTDIQGSTTLWQRDKAGMAAVVDKHLAILEDVITTNRGRRFKTIGDAIQAAFPTAPEAVRAAVAAQRALAAEDWGSFGPLKVRMALHTDEAEPTGDDYSQVPGLNLLARIGAAGHGGQILLSAATQELVRGDEPDQGRLIDLGDHRFRGFAHLERVYQLAVPGLPVDFPRLTTLPPDWPAPGTELIGRKDAVDEVRELVRTERLVTLIGAPGVGKSRLALEAAEGLLEDFADGVFFVELVASHDPELVPVEVARRVGTEEDASRTPAEALTDHLKRRTVLLVVDNFEHVLPAAPLLDELLETCPSLRVLVTSRVPLNLTHRGEVRYPVEPLTIPDLTDLPAAEQLARIPSVALFLSEVHRTNRSFRFTEDQCHAVASICSRLEGLPLAIKLAAPWSSTYEMHVLAAKLERQLPMLEEGGPDLDERHQTMRAAVAWSYNLLSNEQKAMLRLVSVFRGPFSEKAAEKVFQANPQLRGTRVDRGLRALVDRSLVRSVASNFEPLFDMLSVIKEYGEELLATATYQREAEDARKLCSIWYSALGKRVAKAPGAERERLLGQIEKEFENIILVLDFYAARSKFRKLLELSVDLAPLWDLHRQEGIQWLEFAVRNAPEAPTHLRAEALRTAGRIAHRRNDYGLAQMLHEQALDLFRKLDDKHCVAGQLRYLGNVSQLKGQYRLAETLHQECLALSRQIGNQELEADALNELGNAAFKLHKDARAKSLYEESRQLQLHLGDESGVATALSNLGNLAVRQEEFPRAEELLHEALLIHRRLGSEWNEANTLGYLGRAAQLQENLQEAESYYQQSVELARRIEDRGIEAIQLTNLAAVASRKRDYLRAKHLLDQSLSLSREIQDNEAEAAALDALAENSRRLGLDHDANEMQKEAQAVRRRLEQNQLEAASSWVSRDAPRLALDEDGISPGI